MKSSRTYIARGMLMIPIMASLTACGGSDPANPVACGALPAEFKAPDVALTSSTEVAAVAATATAAATPAYCDVRGTIRGNIKFAVYLPKDWNGRFQMVGNGG